MEIHGMSNVEDNLFKHLKLRMKCSIFEAVDIQQLQLNICVFGLDSMNEWMNWLSHQTVQKVNEIEFWYEFNVEPRSVWLRLEYNKWGFEYFGPFCLLASQYWIIDMYAVGFVCSVDHLTMA